LFKKSEDMLIEFSGKVVAITGACSGIGLATAKMMLESGASVLLLDIHRQGKSIAEGLGEKAFFVETDVSRSDSVEAAFKQIAAQHGQLDVLVNNAGIQSYGSVTETSEADWDKTMSVNLKGIFLCSKYAIPVMDMRKKPVIVNVASVKSFVCQDKEAAYVASKVAILGLTQSIASDYSPMLRCVAVCPGAVRTPLLMDEIEKADDQEKITRETEDIHLLKRIAEPEEIASFILFLASDKAGFATGHAYRVDGGIGVRIAGT
jgi:NAD(P)-dependent dehydrogenase (short-subunit alcohol dehydrogenase family)